MARPYAGPPRRACLVTDDGTPTAPAAPAERRRALGTHPLMPRGQILFIKVPMLMRLLLPMLLMVASAAKVELQVCQGPFCSKYGCQSVLLAAKLQSGMAGEAAACFGKQGCQSAFAQKGVRVRADGLGVRTLKGCENPFTALREVGSIAKQFGV